jgi:hypothetical protein
MTKSAVVVDQRQVDPTVDCAELAHDIRVRRASHNRASHMAIESPIFSASFCSA